MKEPLAPGPSEEERATTTASPRPRPPNAKTIGAPKRDDTPAEAMRGRVLGTFRNTYYDFPRESDHRGDAVALKSASCETIATVPRSFHDAVCVQGSGSLARGGTVSFAKRDCPCAELCPRTGQRICFEALDRERFPWGRGAAGRPIVPLRTVAADTNVLPMGTMLYIPELDGVTPTAGGAPIDGCFVVEDRGLRVQGEHVDIFTGDPRQTAALNAQVPSNQGVTVVLDVPKCSLEIRRPP
jgi:3D (Asp-Asp-Asp) domain-containing protein